MQGGQFLENYGQSWTILEKQKGYGKSWKNKGHENSQKKAGFPRNSGESATTYVKS